MKDEVDDDCSSPGAGGGGGAIGWKESGSSKTMCSKMREDRTDGSSSRATQQVVRGGDEVHECTRKGGWMAVIRRWKRARIYLGCGDLLLLLFGLCVSCFTASIQLTDRTNSRISGP